MAEVVSVLGGCGGVGASSFAAALADAAAPSVLLDADPVGGGIDVLLGIESVRGARWSGLRVDGGHLDPAVLAGGLPHWRSVAVLAADVGPPSASAAVQVLEVAGLLGTVVLDLPRAPSPVRDELLARSGLTVVVAAAEVRAVAAARAVLASLPGDCVPALVVRRGALPVDDVVALLDIALLGVLPALDRSSGPSRAVARLAAGVLDGLKLREVA